MNREKRRFRIGVDTGGTFTGVVLVDEASGEILVAKTLLHLARLGRQMGSFGATCSATTLVVVLGLEARRAAARRCPSCPARSSATTF